MGCAIHYDWFSINIKGKSDKFNGRLLRQAREFEGFEFDEFAKKTGFGTQRLNDLESGLRQPSETELTTITEFITSFLKSFYYQKTILLEKPNITFMCGSGIVPCASCGQVADYLCDYPVGDGKTCSLPICNECRTHVGQYDFCPVHKVINQGIQVIQG